MHCINIKYNNNQDLPDGKPDKAYFRKGVSGFRRVLGIVGTEKIYNRE